MGVTPPHGYTPEFWLGYDAYLDNIPIEDCPYLDNVRRQSWQAGHDEAWLDDK